MPVYLSLNDSDSESGRFFLRLESEEDDEESGKYIVRRLQPEEDGADTPLDLSLKPDHGRRPP